MNLGITERFSNYSSHGIVLFFLDCIPSRTDQLSCRQECSVHRRGANSGLKLMVPFDVIRKTPIHASSFGFISGVLPENCERTSHRRFVPVARKPVS